jgi:2-amino-4-hydroxy-6-hydroxymethyldihydropteridine diphosphokinase
VVRVFVSIGSNIDKERHVRAAVAELRRRYGDIVVSSVYESEPVGMQGETFYNLVAAFVTDQTPRTVAAALREIESRHQRDRRGARFVSRTLDLDLILYGDTVLKEDGLVIPRAEVSTCAYALWPLAEIAGGARHPVSGERFSDMWSRFDKTAQPIWPVDLRLDDGEDY